MRCRIVFYYDGGAHADTPVFIGGSILVCTVLCIIESIFGGYRE